VPPTGQSDRTPAPTDVGLNPGERIRTGSSGEAFVTPFEASTMQVFPDTEPEMRDPNAPPEGPSSIVFKQFSRKTRNVHLHPEEEITMLCVLLEYVPLRAMDNNQHGRAWARDASHLAFGNTMPGNTVIIGSDHDLETHSEMIGRGICSHPAAYAGTTCCRTAWLACRK